ncbi:MAG: hypothetical protein ACXU7D_06765 [Burkholderiaceae bacterium]
MTALSCGTSEFRKTVGMEHIPVLMVTAEAIWENKLKTFWWAATSRVRGINE